MHYKHQYSYDWGSCILVDMFGKVNHFQEFEELQNFSKISKVYLNLFLGNSFSILSFSMETSHGKSIKLQKMFLEICNKIFQEQSN